ncbi:ABC transporter substrate-binding protein [Euzebya sp.]|uniref:ABC transporter substrate-binding protein n=1 Tax=Euzebya sp. TaxID=1971409 RepID=UPI0035140AF5
MIATKRWLVLLVVLAMGLAACGGGDGDEEGTDTGTEEAGDDAAADEETDAPADDAAEETEGGDDAAADSGGGEDISGTEVTVFGAPTSVEADAINAVIDETFDANTGASATYEGSDSFEEQIQIRVEGGNPPDIALYPQPGAVIEQAEAGNAVSLETLGFDIADLEARFGEYLLSLGEYEGEHYGLPTNVNFKSLVWYNLPVFEEQGYEIPETYEDMLALTEQMVSDGFETPWCIGTGSDAATGWPATDFMEDIVLRQAGPDVYDQWVTHEIPFDDPAIVSAGETMAEITHSDYVLGGTAAIPDIDFRDAMDPMVAEEPGCLMHRQASFAATFFPEGTELGTDIDTFPFPSIDGNEGALIAGEMGVIFRDAPEVREFIDVFSGQEAQCLQGSQEGISRISPNLEVGPDCYSDPLTAQSAEAVVNALSEGTARFDASDLMPPEVGSGSFWTAMNEWMRGSDLESVLADVEASWP